MRESYTGHGTTPIGVEVAASQRSIRRRARIRMCPRRTSRTARQRQRVRVTLRDGPRGVRVEAARARQVQRVELARRRSSRSAPSHSACPAGARRPAWRAPARPGTSDSTASVGIEVVAEAAPSSSMSPAAVGPVPDDREDRHAGLDQRDRPVLEVGRGVRVGEDVGKLLDLDRPLPRGRVLVAAGEDEQPVGGGLVASAIAAMSGSRLEHRRERRRGSWRAPPCRPRRRSAPPTVRRSRAARSCRSWSRRSPVPGRPTGRSSSPAATASGEVGSLVIATVGAPWRRRRVDDRDDVGRGARTG